MAQPTMQLCVALSPPGWDVHVFLPALQALWTTRELRQVSRGPWVPGCGPLWAVLSGCPGGHRLQSSGVSRRGRHQLLPTAVDLVG